VHLIFLYHFIHLFDSFQNYATMNCQRNVNFILPTKLPHKFSYIVAILGHNHFESLNIQGVAQLTPQRKLTCADSNNITGKTDLEMGLKHRCCKIIRFSVVTSIFFIDVFLIRCISKNRCSIFRC
jgi:hypothetical protein